MYPNTFAHYVLKQKIKIKTLFNYIKIKHVGPPQYLSRIKQIQCQYIISQEISCT